MEIMKKLGVAPSLTAAANITQYPESVIATAREQGCEAFRANGDTDCDMLKEWLINHPEILEAAAKEVNYSIEEALKMRADRMLKEHKLAEAVRKVIPVDEMKRTLTKNVIAAKSRLQSGEKVIAMKAKMRLNLTDEQVTLLVEMLAAEHIEVMKALAKGDWINQACPHCNQVL